MSATSTATDPGDASAEPAAPAEAPCPGRAQAWRWGVAAWLGLRLISSLSAWASLHLLSQGNTVAVPGYTPPHLSGAAGVLAGTWLRADALWYLKIAVQGYGSDHRTFAFLPAFPLFTWALRPLLGGNELYAGLVVANIACLLGLVWLFGVVQELLSDRAARATVVGLALFPTAFFLVAPYGEPVLLAAGAGALLAQLRGRPVLAAAGGVVAALARPFGALIALPLAAFAIARPGPRRRWLAPLGPLVGAAAWAAFVGRQVHDPLGALRVQAVWQRSLHPPWATLWAGLQTWRTWRGSSYGPYFLGDLLAAVVGIALVAAAYLVLQHARRRGAARPVVAWGFAAFGALALIAPLSTPFLPRPLMSVPRFVLAMFPVFVGYALIPRRWRIPLAVLSAAGLAVTTAVYVAARPIF